MNVEKYFSKNGNLNSNLTKKITIPEEYNWCVSKSEYIYALKNNIIKRPLCKHCKINPVNYISSGNYKEYCSIKCLSNALEVKEKRVITSLLKYNETNPSKSQLIKNKVKNTNLIKYGVSYYSQTKEFKKRRFNLKRFFHKIGRLILKRYGITNRNQLEITKLKVKETKRINNLKK